MQFARQLKTYGRKTVRWDGFTNHKWIILGMVGGIGFISLGNSVISILSRFQFEANGSIDVTAVFKSRPLLDPFGWWLWWLTIGVYTSPDIMPLLYTLW